MLLLEQRYWGKNVVRKVSHLAVIARERGNDRQTDR